MSVVGILGWLLLALALAATGYQVHILVAMRTFSGPPWSRAPAVDQPVTLLKPLHGTEPRLAENLATFLAQEWAAPVQLVLGANRADDPALGVARVLPGDVAIVTDAPAIGANAKVANLANMLPAAAHDLLVLSDSDMAVPPDYLARVTAALDRPGVGAVTCLYTGRGDAGPWSRLVAAAIDWGFAPAVMMSVALRIDQPCMGSTIALRRATLGAIGGFAAFADVLADDHAIGAAVRRLGLSVELVPGLLLTHACTETSFGELWRHELRWAGTVRAVTGMRYLGLLVTNPLPLALLAAVFHPVAALIVAVPALALRLGVARAVGRMAGGSPAPLAWLPVRDCLSFATYLASFAVRRVDWRGASLRMEPHGRVSAAPES